MDVDFIAVSFCRNAADMDEARAVARKPPAHHAMRRGDWSGLDYRCKPRALLVIEDRGPARRLARRQTIGTAFVEPQDPVAHDLQRDAGNLRRFAPAPTIQDQSHRSEEHTSELQSLIRIQYDVFCLKKKK